VSFFSRIGDAFGKVGGAIGATWSAADEIQNAQALQASFAGVSMGDVASTVYKTLNPVAGVPDIVDPLAKRVAPILGDAGQAINTGVSYGFTRPLSTALQVLGAQHNEKSFAMTQQNYPIFDTKSWSTAWDRSGGETDAQGNKYDGISAGQAFTTNALKDLGSAPGEKNTGSATFADTTDPFSPEVAQQRNEFFHHTWAGKIDSGAVDAYLQGGAITTARRATEVARLGQTVKAGKVAGALDQAAPARTIPTLETHPPTADEVHNLLHYTIGGDAEANKAANAGETNDITKNLDSLFKRSPSDQPMTVYRTVATGLNETETHDLPAQFKPGDTYTSKQFLSTSTTKDGASSFVATPEATKGLPVVMEIQVPAGTPAIDVDGLLQKHADQLQGIDKGLAENSVHPDEAEQLLPRGTKLSIQSDGQDQFLSRDGSQVPVRYIKAQVVNAPFAPPKGYDRWGQKIAKIFSDTGPGTSMAEMANKPEFRDSGDAGILAYFFDQANRLHPGTDDFATQQRNLLKSNVLGAALGDNDSIAAIKNQYASLANEFQRLGEAPKGTDVSTTINWQKDGQGQLQFDNPEEDAIVAARKDEITREQLRLNRLTDIQSSTSKVSSGVTEKIGQAMRNFKLTESIQPSGLGGAALRYVVGNAQTRVPGFVHAKDPSRGYEDLLNVMAQNRFSSAETKKALTDEYLKAATDGDRRAAIAKAESQMFTDYATHYGVDTDTAQSLLSKMQARRGAYLARMSDRLYSAQAENPNAPWVHVHDPEDDMNHIFSTPLLRSQLEDAVAITDPRVLDKALKSGATRRPLIRASKAIDDAAAKAGGPVANAGAAEALADGSITKAQQTADLTGHIMTMYSRGWKDLALMRGAYPIRIQADTQMRLMASMSKMQYMMSLTKSIAGVTHYLLSDKDDNHSLLNFFKEADLGKAARQHLETGEEYQGIPVAASRSAEETKTTVAKIASIGGAHADLGNDHEDKILRGMRGTGNFVRIDPTDPEWFGHWKRGVDQIRVSPSARLALVDQNPESLVKSINANADARDEWLNLAAGQKDQHEWAANVIGHVNHMLPTDELRGILLKSQLAPSEPMAAAKLAAVQNSGERNLYGMTVDDASDAYNKVKPQHEAAQARLKTARLGYTRAQKAYARARQLKAPRARSARPDASIGEVARDFKNASVKDTRDKFKTAEKNRNDALRVAQPIAKQHAAARLHLQSAEQRERNVSNVQNDLANPLPESTGTYTQAEKYFKNPDNRMPVHGEAYDPTKLNAIGVATNNIRTAWYRTMADMPETIMGRSPLYSQSFTQYMKDAIDRGGTENLELSDIDGIRRAADKRARQEVANIMFDASDTSNAAHSLRFVSPFFSAWEDTMKKWGKLIYNDPGVALNLNNAWQAPNNAGLVVDSNGNHVNKFGKTYDPATGAYIKSNEGSGQYVVLPKALFGWAVPGGGKLKLSKTSANILFQGNPPWLPGVGPLVEVPTNEISKRLFPTKVGTNPILKYVLPYGNSNENFVDQALLPSWVQQAKNAFGNSNDHANVYAELYAEQLNDYENGKRSTKPTVGEINNKTRNWFILRAVLGNVAPVTAIPQPESQLYIDKAHAYQSKYGNNWENQFYHDFPQYFDLAVSLSANPSGINSTVPAYDEAQKYKKQIANNPSMGWFFVGADNLNGQFDPNVYTAQQASGLRTRKTPQEAIADIQAQKGWQLYDQMSIKIGDALAARGLTSTQAKGAEDLASMKKAYTQYLEQNNDAWRIDFEQQDSSKVQTLVNTAKTEWSSNPSFAKRTDQVALQNYLAAREMVTDRLKSTKTTLTNPANAQLAQFWGAYTQYLQQNSIGFQQIYDRVLERDDLSQDVF
jgi:hypothetical protein